MCRWCFAGLGLHRTNHAELAGSEHESRGAEKAAAITLDLFGHGVSPNLEHARSHWQTGSTSGPVETTSIVTSMLPHAAWGDGRARCARPTTRPNSRNALNAARISAAKSSGGSPACTGSHVTTWIDASLHSSHVQRRRTDASGVDSSER